MTLDLPLAPRTRDDPEVATDGDRVVSWIVGILVVASVTAVYLILVPALRHWFLAPVFVCGILIVPDAVDWARQRLDTFDPQALLGLIGTYFFYICPILHVQLGFWAKFLDGPPDWRNALGQMALLNMLGLLLYRAVMAPRITLRTTPVPATSLPRFRKLVAAFAVGGALAFTVLLVGLGGPAGYADTMANDRQALAGLGPVLMVSIMFPTAVLVVVLVRLQRFFQRRPSALFLVIPAYVAVEFVVGGLGGSRSHTVWCIILALGLCHVLVKPIRRRALAILAVILVVFMYFYGFYKDQGSKALQALTGQTTLSQLSSSSGRDLPSVLLEDFGRADIQALVLERHREGHAPLEYGQTYLGDLAFLVPGHAVLGRFPDKVHAGTDLLYGRGSYAPDFMASQVYGLAGEGILNFGAPGAVLAFLPLGLLMRWAAGFYRRALSPSAPIRNRILAPGLSMGAALVLTSDLDNMAWFVLNYLLLFIVLSLASRAGEGAGHGTGHGVQLSGPAALSQDGPAAAPATHRIMEER